MLAIIISQSVIQAAGQSTAIKCPGRQLPYPRQEPVYNGKVQRDFSPFLSALNVFAAKASSTEQLVSGKTIPELQQLMKAGQLSSEDLVLHYLHRIQLYDIDKLNSVMELNPDALTIARAKDAERKAGKAKGWMHGIPVLLKDNIATADKMHTTAGAAALRSWKPASDAFLVTQLRKAGAIIIGKANLSEWANYMDPCMPSGFSVNGGQTRNPYGPFDTWGSSSGSAVSVAADFVTVSVGSETQGSIIVPAVINSVAGLKTSMGLISRNHVIPLLGMQDVPGPMARNITDLAILLSAMTGYDRNDKATKKAKPLAGTDFTRFLQDAGQKKFRVGVLMLDPNAMADSLKKLEGKMDSASLAMRRSMERRAAEDAEKKKALLNAGITVVPLPASLPVGLPVSKLLEYGFKEDLNNFLQQLGSNAPHRDLAAIIDYNKQDLKNRAPYGQGYLEAAQQTLITAGQYDSLRRHNQARARHIIDSLLSHYQVDAIMHSLGQVYAPAGYPALSVPAGYDDTGKPVSFILVGTYLSEPTLLAIGYALEQATKARRQPDLEATLKSIGDIKRISY